MELNDSGGAGSETEREREIEREAEVRTVSWKQRNQLRAGSDCHAFTFSASLCSRSKNFPLRCSAL